jgi:uncharacterized protein YbaP (TraB family)
MVDPVRRTLLGAGAACCAAPSLGWTAAIPDLYPLWLVRRGAARVYLFGDCGSIEDPWRSPRVELAFARSAVFWKETPDLVPNDIVKFLRGGTDPTRPLADWLTLAQQARLAKSAASLGLHVDAMQTYQPWLAAGALSQAAARRQKPSADPLTVLSAAAKAAGKPVRTEFADVDALIAWWRATPPQSQVEYLMTTIDAIEADPADWSRRQAAWAAGDLSLETARVQREVAAYPHAYEAETASRNRNWPARFSAMLEGGGTTFVLVGADHLVGPQSVLAGLGSAGLPARRI